MNKIFLFKSLQRNFSRHFFSQLVTLPGASKRVNRSKDVTLRGTYIKGNFNDLPNLIFFSECLDPVNNWVNFFTDPNNRFLDYRNVYLLNPRNFGNSDYHPSFELDEMADDVIRFMYEQKISTATLGGHGFGGKLALAVGCYHAERVNGVFCLDSAPLDQRYHEAFKELKGVVNFAHNLNLNRGKNDIEVELKEKIFCPKWRKILNQNLIRMDDKKFQWNFDSEALDHNLQFNSAVSLGYWAVKHGMYTGRALFVFPDYSRWIHLNTNTISMKKVCARVQGFGIDVFALQGDENPLNHWMYESETYSYPTSRKLLKFLTMYDGVHILLKDRTEVGNYFLPDKPFSRSKSDWEYADYSPAHLHHNWRFSNVYDKKAPHDEEKK